MTQINSSQNHCCTTCKKTDAKLMRCAKCSKTTYCSRDCQRTDWKAHKKICPQSAGNSPDVHLRGAGLSWGTSKSPANSKVFAPGGRGTAIDTPFTRLHRRTWLHDRPRKEVYKLLIDTYRLRLSDSNRLAGGSADADADANPMHGGSGGGDDLAGFRGFLAEARSRLGLLPPWWDGERQRECEALGTRGAGWSDLGAAVDKAGINEHYGDPRFAMQLRLVGETVYGTGTGGQPGPDVVRHMMAMEAASGTFSKLRLDTAAHGAR